MTLATKYREFRDRLSEMGNNLYREVVIYKAHNEGLIGDVSGEGVLRLMRKHGWKLAPVPIVGMAGAAFFNCSGSGGGGGDGGVGKLPEPPAPPKPKYENMLFPEGVSGDIFRKGLYEGDPVVVFNGEGFESSPDVSPSGKWTAYNYRVGSAPDAIYYVNVVRSNNPGDIVAWFSSNYSLGPPRFIEEIGNDDFVVVFSHSVNNQSDILGMSRYDAWNITDTPEKEGNPCPYYNAEGLLDPDHILLTIRNGSSDYVYRLNLITGALELWFDDEGYKESLDMNPNGWVVYRNLIYNPQSDVLRVRDADGAIFDEIEGDNLTGGGARWFTDKINDHLMLFSRVEGGTSYDVWLYNSETGGVTKLTDTPEDEFEPEPCP